MSTALPISTSEACAAAIAAGGLVVLGTETVYGLAASLAHAVALERLDAARQALLGQAGGVGAGLAGQGAALVAWHAPSGAAVLESLGSLPRQATRAISRLTPGPLAIMVEQAPEARAATAGKLGLVAGAIACQDHTGTLVRVPDEVRAQRVLAAAGVPVGAIGLVDAGGNPATDAATASALLARAGVVPDAVLDVGPTRLGRPSDRLRLRAAGGWALEVGRIFDSGYIARQMARTILFVCTGNTCRSPMAQAIAAGLARGQAAESEVRFVSAGVAAAEGAPYSRETLDAVRRMGFAAPAGSSQQVSAGLIRGADVVYAMTSRHRDAVLAMDPTARGKVHLVDPDGGDVADPVGGPQSLYDSTAALLRGMLERRRVEWGP